STGTLTGSGSGELLLGINAANNVSVNNVVLAQLIGTGSATGRLQMRGGTFAVTGSVTDGGGASTLQVDGGTMTIANGLQVDNLRVAFDGTSANLTVSGGDVAIGTGTESFNIGSRSAVTTGTTTGIVDFSAAASVNINVAQLGLAQIPGGSGATAGTLILPTTGSASISATVISLGDIPSASGSGSAYLQLGGGVTDIAVDDFYVGYRKKSAEVTIQPGGVLNIAGRSGTDANLYVGYNAVHTIGDTTGTMDLAGSTFNAVLNNLIVGYHTRLSNGGGSGTGVLTFDAGEISANSMVIGSGSTTYDGKGVGTINMNGGSLTAGGITLGAGNSNTRGTFNLAGGTLSAGSIVRGVAGSTNAFNFTGGTLHVDQFGSAALPFDLVQQGGTLAPGRSIGTTAIYGNYTQAAAGTLEIEIAGLASFDLVAVSGDALLSGSLNVLLLDSYTAALGDYFDILTTTGDLTVEFASITGDTPNPVFGWWETSVIEGVDGFTLRLSAVPEPGSAMLVLLGIAILMGRRRRQGRVARGGAVAVVQQG
ncbi:MAG: PEP-CTERM sorting domain-containing protein, partial [Patescibacteria group bacterium]|nr:PEP-CTERM sorting domain-containing protein [Patescibacteria group bacterium]